MRRSRRILTGAVLAAVAVAALLVHRLVAPAAGGEGGAGAEDAASSDGRPHIASSSGEADVLPTIEATPFRPAGDDPASPSESAAPPRRLVDVLVVDAKTSVPIAGARVRARVRRTTDRGEKWVETQPQDPAWVTDSSGIVILACFEPGERGSVGADAEGWFGGATQGDHDVLVDATDSAVRVGLMAGGTCRWPLADGEVPAPADGTPITLHRLTVAREAAPGRAAIASRALVVTGVPPWGYVAIAKTPDGALAEVWNRSEPGQENEPVSFRRPRTLTVSVRDLAGEPVAGWEVDAHDRWNGPLAPRAVTDAQGLARFEGLLGGSAKVSAGPRDEKEARANGTVDLERGDQRLELVTEAWRRAEVRIRVDGAPGLPPMLTCTVDGASIEEYEEDAANGEIRLRIRPKEAGTALSVAVAAPGYRAVRAALLPAGGGPDLEAAIDLIRTGSLRVRVRTRELDNRLVGLERRGEDGTWIPAAAGNATSTTEKDVRVYSGLEPGRYRAHDVVTGAVSDEAGVAADAAPAEVFLDLSREEWVRGRVVAPKGTRFGAVSVRAEGEGLSGGSESDDGLREGRTVPCTGDGRFEIRVPGDRPVTLKPIHPVLTAATDGTVTLVRATGTVELRLVEATVLRFEPPPEVWTRFHSRAPIRVLLFAPGDVSTVRFRRSIARLDDRVVRVGGVPAGTWDLWIDVPGFALWSRARVVLCEGETDLGAPAFDRGSAIRLHILSREGLHPPDIRLHALRLGEPPYERVEEEFGATELTLRGLGPGRFRVSILDARTRLPRAAPRELEIDGAHDLDLDYDAR